MKLANTANIIAQPVFIVDGKTALATSSSTATTKNNTPSSTTQVLLLAANNNRRGATIKNSDANPLYIDVASGVTANDHMQAVSSGAYYEVPFHYTGAIYGVWSIAGTGAALVREFT